MNQVGVRIAPVGGGQAQWRIGCQHPMVAMAVQARRGDQGSAYTLASDLTSVEHNTSVGVGTTPYAFASAQTSFSITDISEAAELDPDDPLAFAAGFTFESGKPISYTQTPRTNAPEPGSVVLLSVGVFGMAFSGKRSRR